MCLSNDYITSNYFWCNTHDNTRNQRNKKVKAHTNEEIQKVIQSIMV